MCDLVLIIFFSIQSTLLNTEISIARQFYFLKIKAIPFFCAFFFTGSETGNIAL